MKILWVAYLWKNSLLRKGLGEMVEINNVSFIAKYGAFIVLICKGE